MSIISKQDNTDVTHLDNKSDNTDERITLESLEDKEFNWNEIAMESTGSSSGFAEVSKALVSGGVVLLGINALLALKDAMDNKPMPLGSNIISLVCVVSEDLPVDVRNAYCKSIEVISATMIKSLIGLNNVNRLNSNAKDIFKKLPFHTAYDTVTINKTAEYFMYLANTIFATGPKVNGTAAVDVFTESYLENMAGTKITKIAFEDAILKESKGAVPTYVEVGATLFDVSGRATEKKFTIGVEVKPKVVTNVELVQMLLKQNANIVNSIPEARPGIFSKIKNIFTLGLSKAKTEVKKANKPAVVKTLNDSINMVRGIEKPFIYILMSNITNDMLLDANYDITNASNIRKIYNNLPIASVGIYDINTDTINVSLNRSNTFVKRTSGEFNSEISRYERELAELVSFNKVYR